LTKQNNWGGLLIEPHPESAEKLRQCYRNQLSVLIIEAAAGIENGKTILYTSNEPQMSSLWPIRNQEIMVRTIAIKDIVQDFDLGKIGIFTIDTEGLDFPILKEWFTTDSRPQIIITESWPHLRYQNMQKMMMLAKDGYKKVLHCGENEIYIRG
jgi:FkbM family methyltransferase